MWRFEPGPPDPDQEEGKDEEEEEDEEGRKMMNSYPSCLLHE